MACDGPHQDYAYKLGDEFFEKVMAELKEKHHVDTPDGGFSFNLKEDHEKAKKQLREALRELIWIEHCDSW